MESEVKERLIDEYGEEFVQATDKFVREVFEDVNVFVKNKGEVSKK